MLIVLRHVCGQDGLDGHLVKTSIGAEDPAPHIGLLAFCCNLKDTETNYDINVTGKNG